MKNNLNYPYSPPSDDDITSTNTTPDFQRSHIIMADGDVASAQQNPNHVQGAMRRTRLPPKNDQGQLYCDHANCIGKNQIFKRTCEWNKHMDRHERPYKCREAACEMNPGFTYSGGLLRHQREVHKMHLSTKQPLYCPFPNCNRSSGQGFTRKENLEEHKRRRHLEEMSDHASNREPSQPPESRPSISREPAVKRRRISTSAEVHGQDTGSEVATGFNNIGLAESRSLIQGLQEQLSQKEGIIHMQRAEIHRLQSLFQALPSQTVYGVTQMMRTRMPGSGVGVG